MSNAPMERQLLDAVTDAVIVTDLEARITYWNRGAENLFGYKADEVYGRNVVEVIPPQSPRGDPMSVVDHVKRGSTWTGEFVTKRNDGTDITTYIINTPLRDQSGDIVGVIGVAKDVTFMRELGRAHRRSEGVSRAMLEAVPDLVFRFSSKGEYLDIRSHDPNGLVAPFQELLGRNLADFLPQDITASFLQAIEQALTTSTVQTCEYRLKVLSGDTREYEARIAQCTQTDVIAIVRDVTERRYHERTLIEAKEAAEEMARMKDAFLANMSHEIRTPITSIIGFSDVLMEETTGDLHEMARLIKVGGERLMLTLESVLDLANLESGSIILRHERIDIVGHVRASLSLFRPGASLRGLYLELDAESEPMYMDIDPAALARVFNNILGNALKFTIEGGITVRVASSDEAVVLEVVDTGIGIEDDFRPRLFDEFAQESQGLARSYEGTGLGLAIARRLVDLMNGTIDVTSRKGGGTTFTLVLPR